MTPHEREMRIAQAKDCINRAEDQLAYADASEAAGGYVGNQLLMAAYHLRDVALDVDPDPDDSADSAAAALEEFIDETTDGDIGNHG